MSSWHTYPTYIRLIDGSHVPVVFMFQLDTRELIGGTVADSHGPVSSWIGDLIAARGMPNEVIHVKDANFPGLTDAITVGLADGGYQLDIEPHPNVDDLVWVIGEGGRASAAIKAARPASAIHVTHAIHGLLSRTDALLVAPDTRAGRTLEDPSTVTDRVDTRTAPTTDRFGRRAAGSQCPPLIYGDHPSEDMQRALHDVLRDVKAWGSRTPPTNPP